VLAPFAQPNLRPRQRPRQPARAVRDESRRDDRATVSVQHGDLVDVPRPQAGYVQNRRLARLELLARNVRLVRQPAHGPGRALAEVFFRDLHLEIFDATRRPAYAVLRGVDFALGLGGEHSQVDVGTALEEVAEILGLRADLEDAVLSGEGGAEKVVEEELSVVGLDHHIRDGGPTLLCANDPVDPERRAHDAATSGRGPAPARTRQDRRRPPCRSLRHYTGPAAQALRRICVHANYLATSLISRSWSGGPAVPIKATPAGIIAKLNPTVVDALADPSVRQRLAEIGQEIFPREQQTPEALVAYQKAEIEKWWPIIKAANILGHVDGALARAFETNRANLAHGRLPS
jgi:hypothetical protein